jgi:hypothetical protein
MGIKLIYLIENYDTEPEEKWNDWTRES